MGLQLRLNIGKSQPIDLNLCMFALPCSPGWCIINTRRNEIKTKRLPCMVRWIQLTHERTFKREQNCYYSCLDRKVKLLNWTYLPEKHLVQLLSNWNDQYIVESFFFRKNFPWEMRLRWFIWFVTKVQVINLFSASKKRKQPDLGCFRIVFANKICQGLTAGELPVISESFAQKQDLLNSLIAMWWMN